MFILLSETFPKARKEYKCIWCGEAIVKGEKHSHLASKYEGSFQDQRWHSDCMIAAQYYFQITKESDFEPYHYKRGLLQERKSGVKSSYGIISL